ncbi:hypothetical protein BHE90_010473 [Fusarium euwallaceae]|uniref:Uncharacterized protein n=2 Tax=Fusarium solani species complex TaxID=232080 RepID=A0A428TCI9_9HYPO|nr:hypothetical protein CEP52_009567 [Fusarium oligoseptatum]RTE75073.1 hypothetical protein BHE90_010473 [Fusarium euwallaceae]
MPPIPIYTASPITAAKPSGITPQTAHPEDPEASVGAPNSTDSPTSTYPAAQPGARPSMPAPTGVPHHSADVQPTPTQAAVDASPPAPQPGAVPTPSSYLPPPPKAGETMHGAQAQATEVPMPPQMSYAPLGGSEFAAQRSSTTTAPGPSPMVGLGSTSGLGGPSGSDFSHPPGYHQNVHASEFTSYQRAAHEAAVAQDNRRPSLSLMGDEDGDGVWQAAKKWASAAGDSLAAAEHEVWKRINKE